MTPEERSYTDWARGLLSTQADMLDTAAKRGDRVLTNVAKEIGMIAEHLVELATGGLNTMTAMELKEEVRTNE